MSKQLKPVWRMNTGVRPRELGKRVIFFGGEMRSSNLDWSWFLSEVNTASIQAYQTTRTKEAKYR